MKVFCVSVICGACLYIVGMVRSDSLEQIINLFDLVPVEETVEKFKPRNGFPSESSVWGIELKELPEISSIADIPFRI